MIRKFLDLSTSHVSKETRQWLDDQAHGGPGDRDYAHVRDTDCGWFIWVNEENENIPDDLRVVMTHATANDCDYIMFDADAELIDGLPEFGW